MLNLLWDALRSFARGFGWRFGNDAARIVERAVENELGD